MDLSVVFENDRLVAVSKPSGQLVIPGRGDDQGELLVETVGRYLNAKPYIVHRIDRGTSGLVLFAKDADAQRKLSFLFAGRKIKKCYLALVQGEVEADGTIDEPLRVFGSRRTGVDPRGKPSVTHYAVKERLAGATLLEVRIETGRRHQIRAHLNYIGFPILGDGRYGPDRPVGGVPRLMLHAWKIGLPGFAKKELALRDDPPPEFINILRRYPEKR
ncbi:MAG: RNA pseudouridine synthase [Elusimicrobiota bacterium]